jgi:hypothetical protein
MKTLRISKWIAAGCLAAGLSFAPPALACGGFFCSAQQPVNQSAERIIFAQNDDGTVTAVIQILYQGPSTDFSWLLPISTVPRSDGDIGIASDLAFQRLQAATNPNYVLTTRIEGTCDSALTRGDADSAASPTAGAPESPQVNGKPGVSVEASGVVGSFEWAVILPDASLDDPAAAATEWLEENGYDVAPGAEALLGPYLADDLYLLALKLVKDADVGSIRPIVLTYEASRPMIPIKLTAVAANDDMGVMTWVLGDDRAVPFNYLSLELNEARINWFNANSNYNAVVSEAADEAEGHGFVTEYADTTVALGKVVWSPNDERQWSSVRNAVYDSLSDLWNDVFSLYGTYSGFWDATRATVTPPPNVAFEDFRACASCYAGQLQFSPSEFFAALEKQVIEPNRLVQKLFDDHGYVTRLYSTLSAAEMTVDPVFGFNPDLPAVSNLHSAERVIECSPGLQQFEAPWRVALPQGDVVRGVGANWPTATANEQPPTARILQLSESGPGSVLTDNTSLIDSRLAAHNATVPSRKESDSGCSYAIASRLTPPGPGWTLVVAFALLGAARRRRQRPAR